MFEKSLVNLPSHNKTKSFEKLASRSLRLTKDTFFTLGVCALFKCNDVVKLFQGISMCSSKLNSKSLSFCEVILIMKRAPNIFYHGSMLVLSIG